MIEQMDMDYYKLQAVSDEKKIIDFYRLAADFYTRNKLGLEPIKPNLEELKKASTMEELNNILVALYGKNIR
ncbi:M13 family peptidase, partial [Streptococcus suis]